MKPNIAVFFGGRSVEHEVSIISAMQAIAALGEYRAVPVYITKDGEMYTGSGFSSVESYRDIPKLLKSGVKAAITRDGGEVLLMPRPAKVFGAKPVVLHAALPVTHGTNGEDGTVAGFCEALRLPYAGCDIFSAAVCMDKSASKTLMAAAGLPVLPCESYTSTRRHAEEDAVLLDIEEKFGYPVIIKPQCLGSSVGISRADGREELRDALDLAFSFGPRAIAERCLIDMKEVNCSVIGDIEGARASVCESPGGNGGILSYGDKYLSGAKGGPKGMASGGRRIPADIPAETAEKLQRLAVKTFHALGCEGVVRIDFMLSDNEIYVNEVNTIPGSLAFYLWEASGLSFKDMLAELISLSLKRERRRAQLTAAIPTNILSSFGGMKK